LRELSKIHRLAVGFPAIGIDCDQRRKFVRGQGQEGRRDRVGGRADKADLKPSAGWSRLSWKKWLA